MRPVVLDADFCGSRHAVCAVGGGQGTARLTAKSSIFCREIVRMQVTHHDIEIGIVQPWQIGAFRETQRKPPSSPNRRCAG